MQASHDTGADGLEIVPVVVVTHAFQARPSSVPDIRAFVRQRLSQTPLSGDDIRVLVQRAADVLLQAAGTGGLIEVALRIFPSYAEIDVLQRHGGELAGNTLAVGTFTPANGGPAVPSTVLAANGNGAARSRPVARVTGRSGVSFADWLAEALRREGMTMEAAARQLKVSVKTVSRWVRGTTEPRLTDLSRIRDIFGELPFP